MKLLDLFCGAGGAAVGYDRSGLFSEIHGVDIVPQPRYPFRFYQYDAIEFLKRYGHQYDLIVASPPCQRFSSASGKHKEKHPDLLTPTLEILRKLGTPYVVENVTGARPLLQSPILLCGSMFGLKVYRHRLFEVYPEIEAPLHFPHNDRSPGANKGLSPKGFVCVVGHRAGIQPAKGVTKEYVEAAMGINWMSATELSQAIPPKFTQYIGEQLKKKLVTLVDIAS